VQTLIKDHRFEDSDVKEKSHNFKDELEFKDYYSYEFSSVGSNIASHILLFHI